MKKIAVVTGSRAEYGIMKILLEKINLSKKLELMLYVTGTHLLKNQGNSINIIEKDGFAIKRKIPIYEEQSIKCDLGMSIGYGIREFTYYFWMDNPDLVLVLGDRYEIFASVVAANTLDIPIAHIHGGDHNHEGQVDEILRHCISKFANVHFPATLKSKKRLIQMGEDPKRIYMVGSPAIDMTINYDFPTKDEFFNRLGLDKNKIIVVFIFHSYIPDHKEMGFRMNFMLNHLLIFANVQFVIIYPNNDLGSELIIKEIEKFEQNSKFKIIKNLDRIDYLSLLKYSNAIIGNSSSGIIDSSIFKIPAVNIGQRNLGRESAGNVINTQYNDLNIKLGKALSYNFKNSCKFVKNPYGDGKSSERIVKILENLEINEKLLKKRFIL